MLGATDTTSNPVVAPVGIVAVIDASLQELIVTGTAFNVTTLPPSEAPNPEPLIVTWLLTLPVVAETLVMTGAGAAAELTETLSKVAVARDEVLPLVTASPTYTFVAMLIVWLDPNCVQFTPSADV
jgi:hypothetical protein